MSDIHGQYRMFRRMLDRIGFSGSDRLYVIGDAIDRGPDSIPLLLDIMCRDNVTFLIGNHEHMMLQTLVYKDPDEMHAWMLNSGRETLEHFETMDRQLRIKLLRWLIRCPLLIPELRVGDRRFYLAHACHALYPEHEVLYYKDAGKANIEQIVWSREYCDIDRFRQGYKYNRLYEKYPGTTLIIGHTPVQKCSYGSVTKRGYGRISHACSGHLVNVDCGCASGRTLGCLRLDDMKEYHIDMQKPTALLQPTKEVHGESELSQQPKIQ